jgi:hypothetical protein
MKNIFISKFNKAITLMQEEYIYLNEFLSFTKILKNCICLEDINQRLRSSTLPTEAIVKNNSFI